jgi:DNA-binding transcriptional LysR family regulator
MLDIKPLRYFVTLAETLHFGRAAAQLNLSQPPLSRQIAGLEEQLGVTLFERNAHGVALTPAGQRFHADAQAILAALAQAGRNARATQLGEAGSLSIGFTMCAAYSVVPAYARAFQAAYPQVAFSLREVISNDLAAQVAQGRVDAAISFPLEQGSPLERRTVVSEPLCAVLPRTHKLARTRRLRIAQLAQEPFVLAVRDVSPSLRNAVLEQCRLGGFTPRVQLEVELQQTILSLVAEGVGVSLVPSSMRKVQLDGIVFKPLADGPRIRQELVWSAANRNPCLARFLEVVAPLAKVAQ